MSAPNPLGVVGCAPECRHASPHPPPPLQPLAHGRPHQRGPFGAQPAARAGAGPAAEAAPGTANHPKHYEHPLRSDQRSQEVANHIHLSELAPGPQDVKARAKIASRLDRFTHGNPGDVKSVGDGVSEMRIDYGPGYRVYFTQRGREVVWLLGSE